MLSMKDYNTYRPTTPYNSYNIFTTSSFTNRITPGALLPALTNNMCISWVPQLAVYIWEVSLIVDKLLKAIPTLNKLHHVSIKWCWQPFLTCVSAHCFCAVFLEWWIRIFPPVSTFSLLAEFERLRTLSNNGNRTYNTSDREKHTWSLQKVTTYVTHWKIYQNTITIYS